MRPENRNRQPCAVERATLPQIYSINFYRAEIRGRLLQRAIYYAAHQESELMTYYVDSCEVECTYFPEVKKLAVYNNSFEVQEAQIYVRGEVKHRVTLNEMDLIWLDVE